MTTKTIRIAHKPSAKIQTAVAPTSTKTPVTAKATLTPAKVPDRKPMAAAGARRKVALSITPALTPALAASKQARLITLLRSPRGGTIEQMTGLTGWQAHTVRGTISGVLRKRLCLNVVCSGEPGSRVYRIVEAAA